MITGHKNTTGQRILKDKKILSATKKYEIKFTGRITVDGESERIRIYWTRRHKVVTRYGLATRIQLDDTTHRKDDDDIQPIGEGQNNYTVWKVIQDKPNNWSYRN